MPNITWKKSQSESLEVAYKAALALAPLALESVCPKPVATLIEHFAGSSLKLFFEQEPTTCRGKTLKIIGDALAELFETEQYEEMQSFFAKTDFRMNEFEDADKLVFKLHRRYALYKKESDDEAFQSQKKIKGFVDELFRLVKIRIQADERLEAYWRNIGDSNRFEHIEEMITEDRRKREEEQPAHNHNTDYINKWNERCCLHKSEAQPLVTLEKIFVMPEVQVGRNRLKVGDCVKAFLDDANQHILLLLGHGGYGKTSFVARMAAKTGEYTDRPLHIFRLREFADVKVDKLYQHISAVAKLESNAVLVFDGLDELCMVGGGKETEKSLDLLTQLMFFFDQSSSYKIIITSRPEYISAKKALERLEKLKISAKRFVSYCYAAFSERQRGELVDSIEKADPALKGSLGCEQVRKFEDKKDDANKGDAIYGSPFLLYLICAAHEKLTLECFENRWLLFRTVFHDINPQPDYKKMQENTTGRGAVAMEHLDKLYRITSRLAYEIYKTDYKKQYFQKEEVLNVIRALYPDETSELISALGDCYALCAYFKQTENGAVEFAHNHVRDFFLCEYILQGLDDLYAKRPEMSAEECGKLVADWLSDNFKFTNLQYHDPILKLVEYYDGERYIRYDDALSRIRFLSDASTSIKMKEVYTHVCAYCRSELRYIFNAFCANGGLHKYCYGYKKDEVVISVQTAVRNVMNNSNVIFHCILPKTATKNWWFNVKVFNFSERIIMDYMKHFVNADLCALNMCGLKLLGTDLRGADLRSADLRGADLRGADLSNANLKGARYNNDTNFTDVTPSDFDPKDPKWGMIKVD